MAKKEELLALRDKFKASGKTDTASVKAFQKQFASIRDRTDAIKPPALTPEKPIVDAGIKTITKIPKLVKPKTESKEDRIARQIREATAAGNLEDVATLRGLLGGGTQLTTKADIETGIVDTQFAKQKERFNALLASGKSTLRQEEKAITPRFREEERQLRTADVMAREGTRKLAAPLGGSAAGSGIQSDIAQNVATGEVRAASAVRESNQRADVQARMSELENTIASGLATAQDEAELIKLENDLRRIGIQEERDLVAKDDERRNFVDTIDRFSQDFTQEIQNILNDGDPSNDWKIPLLESARARKVQGIGETEAQTAQDAEDRAFTKWQQGIPLNQEEMDLLGTTRSTKPVKATSGSSRGLTDSQIATNAWKMVALGQPLTGDFARVLNFPEGYVDPNFKGPEEDEETVFTNATLQRGINNAVAIASETPPTEFAADDPNIFNPEVIRAKETAVKIRTIIELVNSGKVADQAQLDQLLLDNGISEEEFDKFLPDEPGTGLGDLANLGG
jgi:hypothetical protein